MLLDFLIIGVIFRFPQSLFELVLINLQQFWINCFDFIFITFWVGGVGGEVWMVG